MMNRRNMLALLGASFAPDMPLAAHAQAAVNAGTVANLRGSATARRAGASRFLGPGQEVFTGEQLQTGAESRLQARLGAATQLYMGERTRVMIDAHLVQRGGTIHLGEGALMFERKDPDPKPPVTIRSPFGMLAVRGTTLFAGPSNGIFGIFVAEGEVIVRAAGASVTLRRGEGTNIARPGAKPTPAIAWGDARIHAALRSVQ